MIAGISGVIEAKRADALLVGAPLFTGPNQTMADLITQARRFNRAWQQNEALTAAYAEKNGVSPTVEKRQA